MNAQLTRGAFMINDFLQNPHLSSDFNIKVSDAKVEYVQADGTI